MSAAGPQSDTFAQKVEHLLREARRGADALSGLLQEYRPLLEGLAERRVPRALRAKVDAPGLVQEALLYAHRHFPNFRGGGEPQLRSWLCRIVRSKARNAVRGWRAQKRDAAREQRIDDSQAPTPLASALAADTPTPSAEVGRREDEESRRRTVEQVSRVLGRLPEVDQAVVRLHHQEGWTFGRIGDLLGISEEAADKRYRRALLKLGSMLVPAGRGGAG